MLTPQEVSSHAFTKSMVGGYNMAMVDEFLDELTDDYTALYKENAVLKAKMKVLVEKVEDYRATEDSMRATLLTAQKMADSIIHEAEAKRDELLTQAEADVRAAKEKMQKELTVAEERLNRGKTELVQFIAASREVCNRELAFLDQLPSLEVEQPAAPVEPKENETVSEIEEHVLAAFAQEEAEHPAEVPPVVQETVEEPVQPVMTPAAEDALEEESAEEEDLEATRRIDLEATRRIDLDELKFGRNYGGDKP